MDDKRVEYKEPIGAFRTTYYDGQAIIPFDLMLSAREEAVNEVLQNLNQSGIRFFVGGRRSAEAPVFI